MDTGLEAPIIAGKHTRGRRVHCRAGTSGSSEGINITGASPTIIKRAHLDSKLLLWSPINMLHLVRQQITIYRRLVRVSIATYLFQYFHSCLFSIAMLAQNMSVSRLFDNVACHASHSILKKKIEFITSCNLSIYLPVAQFCILIAFCFTFFLSLS